MGSEQGVWLCLVGVCGAMDGVTKRVMDDLEASPTRHSRTPCSRMKSPYYFPNAYCHGLLYAPNVVCDPSDTFSSASVHCILGL